MQDELLGWKEDGTPHQAAPQSASQSFSILAQPQRVLHSNAPGHAVKPILAWVYSHGEAALASMGPEAANPGHMRQGVGAKRA